ncbi:MAG: SDR family oxidoreductase [Candidatus Melainabacteria bacterium]|nr:SDR family oxidoreductase [Candidatus Melainabacteria bacterium]
MSKVALITGNSKGLGKAITERLQSEDYIVPSISSQDYDLRDPKQIEKLISEQQQIDLVVNNLGNFVLKSIDDMDFDEWQDMLSTNLSAAWYLSKLALPQLRQSKGSIINIGFAGLESNIPSERIIAYQSCKAGLLTMTRGLAKTEAEYGVRVNMVSPGTMDNSVEHKAMDKIPMDRLASLDEVVDTVCFLIKSDYITGQNIEVAGGWGL